MTILVITSRCEIKFKELKFINTEINNDRRTSQQFDINQYGKMIKYYILPIKKKKCLK